MQEFNEFTKCPKCRETFSNITKTYIADITVHKETEYLQCHCKTCGYDWKQRTADAE